MLHVDIPSRAELLQLFSERSEPSVSIYLKTTPITPNTEADRIELKNLASKAIAQLQQAGVNSRQIGPIEDAIGDLIEDDEFWRFQANSLAVLATPERTRTYRLPTRLGSIVEVSDRFHLKPLLRCVASPQSAFVLALGQNSVRLVEVSPDLPAAAVKVDGMPKSATDAVGRSSLVKRGPLGKMQGVEAQQVWLRQFARQVDSALRQALGGRDLPLILAATEPLATIYRSVNTYPGLLPETLTGSPDGVSEHDLAARSRALLDTHFARELASIREEFRVRSNEGRTSTDIVQTAKAATHGVVSTLLVDIDEVVHGTLDDAGKVTLAAAPGPSSYGVVDQIAGRALATGARVLGVRRADIPEGKSLAAIFRYPY
jgi:hypothetical protein